MSNLDFIKKHLNKYKILIIILILSTIVYSGLNLCSSLILSLLIDNVIDAQPITNPLIGFLASIMGGINYIKNHLYIIAITLIIIYVLVALFIHIRQKLQGVVSENIIRDIREELYYHIERLPFDYFSKNRTGELIQKCTSDVDIVRRFFSGQFAEIFYIIFTVSIALIVLIKINWRLSLVSLIFIPIILLYSYIFLTKIEKYFVASDEAEAKMSNVIEESLSGVRVVKAFNREKYEVDKFNIVNQEYHDVTYKVIQQLGRYYSSSYCLCLFSILIMSFFGVIFANKGLISLGDFIIFFNYQVMIVFPIRSLGRILSDLGKMKVSLTRLLVILNEPIENFMIGEKPDLFGDIEFNHVSFKYGEDKNVLNDISFKVKQGSNVAIVGSTGCGKSSLVHLLDCLYDNFEGDIFINGYSIKSINKQYLRQNVALVLQEPFLFSRSIKDNLLLVKPDATDEEIHNVCKIACIHDVIMGFDKGYDTIIGENGVTLSGGQKQRIAIARTLLVNSAILIFDDSLSAVDTETDALITQNLNHYRQNITKFVITQRISSAMNADLIIVMNDGIVEDLGTHQELINREGLYQRIYQIQNSYQFETETNHG